MDYTDRIPNAEYQDEFTALLEGVAKNRKWQEEAKRELKRLLDEFQATTEFQHYRILLETSSKSEEMLTKMIHEAALKPNAQLPDSVKVKNFQVVTIHATDSQLKDFCLKDLRMGLVVDTGVVKNAIKMGWTPSEIGTVSVEKRVQIASDLSKYEHLL